MSGDLPLPVAGRLDFAVEVRLVRVAERDDPGAVDLPEPADELVTTPAHATDRRGRPQPDDRHADRLIGADRPGLGARHQPRHPQRQAGRHRASQKAPARDRFHIAAHHRPGVVQSEQTLPGREPTRTTWPLRRAIAPRVIRLSRSSFRPQPCGPSSRHPWYSAANRRLQDVLPHVKQRVARQTFRAWPGVGPARPCPGVDQLLEGSDSRWIGDGPRPAPVQRPGRFGTGRPNLHPET